VKNHQLKIWLYIGALGVAVFLLLRPSIDFNANAPLRESHEDVEQRTRELAEDMGFSLDSLGMITRRNQHVQYYKSLADSAQNTPLAKPFVLNRHGVNLTSWTVTIASTLNDVETFMGSGGQIFQKTGRLKIGFAQDGKVFLLKSSPTNPNPTFVQGDSLFAAANFVVEKLFGYDLDNYELSNVNVQDSAFTIHENANLAGTLQGRESEVGNKTVFRWKRKGTYGSGPANLRLEVDPIIRKREGPVGPRYDYGVSVISFEASDGPEMFSTSSSVKKLNISILIFYGSLVILGGLVFFVGFKQIFKGQVDWSRAISILVLVALGYFLWRAIYFMDSFNDFLEGGSEGVLLLSQMISAIALGLYGAMAYIGWEALARNQKQDELTLIDAYWRKRFFFRETGESLLNGYALGGVLLGLLTVIMYALNIVYFQEDSQFGFAEASSSWPWFTINLGIFENLLLVSLGHIGVIISLLRSKIKHTALFYSVSTLILGFLFLGSGHLFGTDGSYLYEYILYVVLSIPIVYAFRERGLVTVATGWGIFAMVILMTPYWGSPSLDVALVGWIEMGLLIIPFVIAIVAYKYGDSVAEMEGYVPEYEERIANHLRVEKEIEIARESQYKLMPLKAPSVQGIDIYGFFIPSFEVGGDYFDYVMNRNGNGEAVAVTFTIVDVSGKAMKAAMHAVFTSGLLLSRLHRDEPASILQEIGPTLYYKTDPKTFITCMIGQYNLAQRRLTLANAGHCLPIVKRDGKAEFIKTPNPKYPLGVRERVDYQPLNVELSEGDFILFYSDGLPEAVNTEGQRFGYENLVGLVEELETDKKSSQEIAVDIKRRIQKFSDYQLADDTTIICLKI